MFAAMETFKLMALAYIVIVATCLNGAKADFKWLSGPEALWAWNCDFYGNDIARVRAPGSSCANLCRSNAACTHFSFTTYEGGTCWLKHKDGIDGRAAVSNASPWSVCGLRRPEWQIPVVPFQPIFLFDSKAPEYCLPDWASSSTNGICRTSFHPNMPVYVETGSCGGETVYTFWLWYGWQKPCIFNEGSHDDDWEHVSVFVSNGRVTKVKYYQHKGHYTRIRGTFEMRGERPLVYIGKVAHGSYHARCDGKCDFGEIFVGCAGSVNYCSGGCGYWEDFRNPGETVTDYVLHGHPAGLTLDGLSRPRADPCGPDCDGAGFRAVGTSGCWQNRVSIGSNSDDNRPLPQDPPI